MYVSQKTCIPSEIETQRDSIDSRSLPSEGSAQRNKKSQADAIEPFLSSALNGKKAEENINCIKLIKIVLELASGFGEALVEVATRYPNCTFQPSDAQEQCINSLKKFTYGNILKPLHINVNSDEDWNQLKREYYDIAMCFNLIHLIPKLGTHKIFKHSANILIPHSSFIIFWGAFKKDGKYLSESDKKFDEDIQKRDSRWGLWDMNDLNLVAESYGFEQHSVAPQRKGNFMIVYKLVLSN